MPACLPNLDGSEFILFYLIKQMGFQFLSKDEFRLESQLQVALFIPFDSEVLSKVASAF